MPTILQKNTLVLLAAATLTLGAFAEEDPVQIVPAMWFTESAEVQSTTLRNRPELPRPELVGMYEDDSIANSHYVVFSEFAKDDEQAIFVLFDSGRLVKYDFIDKVTDWQIEIAAGSREFALSPDGKKVAVSSLEHVLFYKTTDGTLDTKLENVCNGHCMVLTISKDGRYVIVGDANGFANIKEITNPANSWRRKMHDWPARKILYIENNNRKFLVTSDCTEMVLYDMDAEEERRRMRGRHQRDGFQDFWITTLAEIPGSNHFVVGGYEDVYILDAVPGTTVGTYSGAEQAILRAYASDDLQTVVGVSRDRVIYKWNADTGQIAASFWMETSIIAQFIHTSISPNGKYTAMASFEPKIAFPPRAFNRVRVYKIP